ncbi:MAG: 50S ribosomal protein L11 methyltransferase [Pseudomonadota bacterium]
MPWQVLKIPADSATATALSDALMELGALSVSIEDAHAGTDAEQPIFGEPGCLAETWNDSQVSALFETDADIAAILQQACDVAEIKSLPPYHIEQLAEQDWVRLTQSQFDPIKISDRLWIVPSWHAAPDPAAINLVLDPGLAFGTGSHPTTRLCLQWLDANLRGGESVLDYGCGSGILAIASKRLGAGEVIGIDIDPQAVQSARDNAARNIVDAHFYLPDAVPGAQYAVVIANILSNPLKVLAPMLASRVQIGGRIVLYGILAEQAEEMRALYGEWFNMHPALIDEGWACLSGIRR